MMAFSQIVHGFIISGFRSFTVSLLNELLQIFVRMLPAAICIYESSEAFH